MVRGSEKGFKRAMQVRPRFREHGRVVLKARRRVLCFCSVR